MLFYPTVCILVSVDILAAITFQVPLITCSTSSTWKSTIFVLNPLNDQSMETFSIDFVPAVASYSCIWNIVLGFVAAILLRHSILYSRCLSVNPEFISLSSCLTFCHPPQLHFTWILTSSSKEERVTLNSCQHKPNRLLWWIWKSQKQIQRSDFES